MVPVRLLNFVKVIRFFLGFFDFWEANSSSVPCVLFNFTREAKYL